MDREYSILTKIWWVISDPKYWPLFIIGFLAGFLITSPGTFWAVVEFIQSMLK